MDNYYSPWTEASQAFGHLGNEMNNVILGLAQQRYQIDQAKQLRQQQRDQFAQEIALKKLGLANQQIHTDAQAKLYQAQSALANRKTMALQEQTDAGANIGNVLQGIVETQGQMAQNPNSPADTTQLFGKLAQSMGPLIGQGRRYAGEGAAQALSMSDPRLRALIATSANPIQSLPSQAGMVNPATGQLEGGMPQKLNEAQSLVPLTGGMPIASGVPRPPSLNDPVQRLLATVGNQIRKDSFGEVVDPKDPITVAAQQLQQQYLQQLLQRTQTNSPIATSTNKGPRAGLQGPSPDKSAARAEALDLIAKHPDKAAAIKARYQETFNEELR